MSIWVWTFSFLGLLAQRDAGPGTDFDAIRRGAVSVTPLQIDLTRYDAIDGVAKWLADTNT